MFFRQIKRNAAKNWKDNGLFFGSLVIAVIAFYTLLSMDKQDVMRFLSTIESDAVSKLMLLVPLVYVVSLFFVFFLVYFSYHYQLNERKREFGMYLMLGMKRSRLFAMLMGETLFNSVVSVAAGIPAALLLTEAISLTTVKVAGLGIIGHEVTWSFAAVIETIAGVLAVQMISMLILSIKIARTDPAKLLRTDASDTQSVVSAGESKSFFIAGCILLFVAYFTGVVAFRTFHIIVVLQILIFGTAGTFLVYRGAGAVVAGRLRKKGSEMSGLYTFTGRQIQENVLCQHRVMAIASLLLLIALSCIAYGIGTVVSSQAATAKTTDFSLQDQDGEKDALAILESEECKKYISDYYPVFLGMIDAEAHKVSVEGLKQTISGLSDVQNKDMQANVLEYIDSNEGYEYVIALSSYNRILKTAGKREIALSEGEAAFYTSGREYTERTDIYRKALGAGTYIEVDGKQLCLQKEIYFDNVVADRQITLDKAFIIPDELYQKIAVDSDMPFCYNALLKEELVDKEGFMQVLEKMSEFLSGKGIIYESYLAGIGRRLFFTVAGSYITIYLGFLFMIIANTSIALKYLMQQQTNRKRYRTLLMLGADVADICRSSAKQIYLFSGMVLLMAAISSVFAVWSMFTGFMKLPEGTSLRNVILLTGAAFCLFVATQMIYVIIIERAGRKQIRQLSER